MFRFQQVTLGDIILVILAGLYAWVVVPGLGPELTDLPTPGFSCQVKPRSKVDVVDTWQELYSLRLRQDSGPGGYKYDFFNGQKDLDHDGCDTRAEVLARDLHHARFDSVKPCRLVGGMSHNPYTGETAGFTVVPGAVVQIDHMVALGDARASGANRQSNAQWQEYTNDPAVLLATDGKANQDKGKLAADGWMPQNKNFHCAYARQQINIKYRWDLSMTPPERQALLLALSQR